MNKRLSYLVIISYFPATGRKADYFLVFQLPITIIKAFNIPTTTAIPIIILNQIVASLLTITQHMINSYKKSSIIL
jgi:hypothetical protein